MRLFLNLTSNQRKKQVKIGKKEQLLRVYTRNETFDISCDTKMRNQYL